MSNLKIATAATMSTLMSLFGCKGEPDKILNLKDEFVKVNTIEVHDRSGKKTFFVTLSLMHIKDSTFTAILLNSHLIVQRLQENQTYYIDGKVECYSEKKFLDITKLQKENILEKKLRCNSRIEQLEENLKASKQNNKISL